MQKSDGGNIRQRLLRILPWIWLALVFSFFLVFLAGHIDNWLDSDMSSEMVLAKQLSNEGGILSKNWYYSTELRVANTQIVMSPLFRLFSDWRVVRIVGSGILALLMLASYYYLCRQMKCEKYFPVTGALLLIPFCWDYYRFVMYGLYYIPHLMFSFLSVGICCRCNNEERKNRRLFLYALSFAVALLAGLGGPRQIMVTYIPLLLAAVIVFCGARFDALGAVFKANETRLLLSALGAFAGGAAGYVINTTYLSSKYSFHQYSPGKWTQFDFDHVVDSVRHILKAFGYQSGKALLSAAAIPNLVSFAVVFALVLWLIHLARARREVGLNGYLVSMVFLWGLISYTVLYAFTEMLQRVRYILPITSLAIPVLAAAFRDSDLNRPIQRIICCALLCALALSGGMTYNAHSIRQKPEELITIVNQLDEAGYQTGYATFWNANILTELSNGAIEMYSWRSSTNKNNDVKDPNKIYKWLQSKAHRKPPQGKVFMLFSNAEYQRFTLCKKLDQNEAFYKSKNYIVFAFDDYDAMNRLVKETPDEPEAP